MDPDDSDDLLAVSIKLFRDLLLVVSQFDKYLASLLSFSIASLVKVGSTETKVDLRRTNFDLLHHNFYYLYMLPSW